MSGHAHFAEVHLDGVFVDDTMILGREGSGWQQVNAELAYERSGPERFLSTFPLLQALGMNLEERGSVESDVKMGELISNLWALHTMSEGVAEQLNTGLTPHLEAAIVKDLGTQFENEIVDSAGMLLPRQLLRNSTDAYTKLLAQSVLAAPGFTLRGGTTEILRGIVSKGMRV